MKKLALLFSGQGSQYFPLTYCDMKQPTELNSDKLLTVIAYKNISLRDSSDLQTETAFLFVSKSDIIKQEILNIDGKFRDFENKITYINDELLQGIYEWNANFYN